MSILMLIKFLGLIICSFLGIAVTIVTLAITVITATKIIGKFLDM